MPKAWGERMEECNLHHVPPPKSPIGQHDVLFGLFERGRVGLRPEFAEVPPYETNIYIGVWGDEPTVPFGSGVARTNDDLR